MQNLRDVKIIRSEKRKKTILAKSIKGKLHIYLPKGLSKEEEKKWIVKMIQKAENRRKMRELNTNGLLKERADELNKKYFRRKLEFDIKYVSNQNFRFGSCTSEKKIIRISDRVANMPRWVQDYVIIHELAHLIYPNHSKEFWEKVNQYKSTERAKGYLIAVGMLSDE